MEEREAHIFNTPAMQIAADAAEQIRIQQAPLIQALQPLQDALQPYHNLIDQNSLGLVAASLSSVAQTIVPDNAVGLNDRIFECCSNSNTAVPTRYEFIQLKCSSRF